MQRSLKASSFFLMLMLCAFSLRAQTHRTDLELVGSADFRDHRFDKRKVTFMLPQKKNVLIRYNPVSLFFGSLMYIYQKGLSPAIAADCPYEISCSGFSRVAIRECGLFKGIFLSADRLMRCNQLAMKDVHRLDIDPQGRIIDPISQYRSHKR